MPSGRKNVHNPRDHPHLRGLPRWDPWKNRILIKNHYMNAWTELFGFVSVHFLRFFPFPHFTVSFHLIFPPFISLSLSLTFFFFAITRSSVLCRTGLNPVKLFVDPPPPPPPPTTTIQSWILNSKHLRSQSPLLLQLFPLFGRAEN